MKTLELKKAVGPLREYASARNFEPLVLTTDGKPVAALVHLENADWETIALSTSSKFKAIIERSRERATREGTIPAAQVRREFGIPAKVTRQRKK